MHGVLVADDIFFFGGCKKKKSCVVLLQIVLAALPFFTVNIVFAVCTASQKHCHFCHFTLHIHLENVTN